MIEHLLNNKPSKNAETITKGIWLIGATILIFYFFDTKAAVDSIAQDYPSLKLATISKWAPTFFPVPSLCFAAWHTFPRIRKILKIASILIIIFIAYILYNISQICDLDWGRSLDVLCTYLLYILLGSLMACESPKKWFGNIIDLIFRWRS